MGGGRGAGKGGNSSSLATNAGVDVDDGVDGHGGDEDGVNGGNEDG